MRSLILLALCTLTSRAEDPFAGLRRGDRVELVTDLRAAFDGVVRSVVGDRLRLEVLREDGSVFGSVTFEAKEVRSLKRSGTDPEALTRKPEPAPEPVKPVVEPEPPAIPDPPPSPAQLLERFPESAWSATRMDEISESDEWLREPEERAFLRHFKGWAEALEAQKRAAWAAKFPESEGWTEEKRDRLRRRFVVLGVALASEEREFVAGPATSPEREK